LLVEVAWASLEWLIQPIFKPIFQPILQCVWVLDEYDASDALSLHYAAVIPHDIWMRVIVEKFVSPDLAHDGK